MREIYNSRKRRELALYRKEQRKQFIKDLSGFIVGCILYYILIVVLFLL